MNIIIFALCVISNDAGHFAATIILQDVGLCIIGQTVGSLHAEAYS